MDRRRIQELEQKANAGDTNSQRVLDHLNNSFSPTPGSGKRGTVASSLTRALRSPAEREAVIQSNTASAPTAEILRLKREVDDAKIARETEDWWQDSGRQRGEGLVGAPLAMAMNYFNKDKKTAARTEGSTNIARKEAELGLQQARLAERDKGVAALTALTGKEDAADRLRAEADFDKTASNKLSASNRTFQKFHDPSDRSKQFNVGVDAAGDGWVKDPETGQDKKVDITNLETWDRDWSKKQTAAEAKERYGDLTPNQLQTGLNKYEQKLEPVERLVDGVASLNAILEGLDNPNEDIPGIGAVEGGSGYLSQAVRYVSDIGGGDSEKINAAWTGVIAPLIRQQAGLAQTQTEINKVEQQFGGNWLSDEKTFREAYPRIMKVLQNDLARIKATTMPSVGNYYEDVMGQIGQPTVYDKANELRDPFKARLELDAAAAPVEFSDEELMNMSEEDFDAAFKGATSGG